MATRLVLLEPQGKLHLQAYQPTDPKPGQIQVRNEATSLNHLDWVRISKNIYINSFPQVLGMDIAGRVVNSGSSTRFQIGDPIICPGFAGISDSCSYQTNVLVNEDHCAKISKDIPLADAATLPFCLVAAACGLYLSCGLSHDANFTDNKGTTLLIWGGNGNVGKLAIQLAKISGYNVIAVVSSETRINEAVARSADTVLSNDDPDLIPKIRAIAPNLQHVFDTVVSQETVSKAAQCLSPGGTIATATKYFGLAPEGLFLNSVYGGEVFGKTMAGQDSPRGKELGRWLWANLSTWLDDGRISPLEYENIGNLSDVETGLERMQAGLAHTKLVVMVG